MTNTSDSSRMRAVEGEGEYILQVLDSSYFPECARVMAQAFSDSPSYKYIFPATTQEFRTQALEWLFLRNLELTVGKCPSALRGMLLNNNNNKHDVAVCFLWTPGRFEKISLWQMIQAGLWKLPFKFGSITYVLRLLKLLDAMDEKSGPAFATAASSNNNNNNKNHDDNQHDDYIILERMVVRPDCQGQGWGSKALKAVLETSDATVQVRLITQEERNVRFYQRVGFEVIQDEDFFPEDPHNFHSWCMVRKPTIPVVNNK